MVKENVHRKLLKETTKDTEGPGIFNLMQLLKLFCVIIQSTPFSVHNID